MIGVIFTGGTIGSTLKNGYIGTDKEKSYRLISMYEEKYGKENFLTDKPCEILSENITFKDYGVICDAVLKMMEKKVDGIILTHGSDTIQYTAALLSYIFNGTDIPILVVCSNYVLDDKNSNGPDNFRAAVRFIKESAGRGVFVPYTGRDKITRIFYGNTLLMHHMYSDELYALDDAYYGYFEDGEYKHSNIPNPSLIEGKYELPAVNEEDSGIRMIYPYPGMKYPVPKNEKAFVHCTYHSGTICGVSKELKRFALEAGEKNIPVYIVGKDEGMDYESCKIYSDCGFTILPHMTNISAYFYVFLTTRA